MGMDVSMVELPATELRRRIGSRELSPVELLEACFERMAALNPAVNAVTARDDKTARKAAKAAEKAVLRGEELGLLHGLPIGIKDLNDTEGLLTSYGSPLHRSYVPKADDGMVARVRGAGGIIAGKTNVPEFGAGANSRNLVWGATGNAFDPELNAAGSSGGSAVALATDMLPLCTGSDTGGSLRTPAAYNGIVGFRPSPGLVPYPHRGIGWTSISVLGPMARNVGDLCLLLGAQAGFDDHEPLGFPLDGYEYAQPISIDLGRLRVAWTTDFGVCPVSKVVKQAFKDKVAAMRHLFLACDEIKPKLGDVHRTFDVIRAMNFLARHKSQFDKDPSVYGDHVRVNIEFAMKLTFDDACRAMAEHTRIFRAFQDLYLDYDLILSPMAAVPPRPWTEPAVMEIDGEALDIYYRWLSLAYVTTLATNPSVSLPCGTHAGGLPFGLQAVGRFRDDIGLLGAAHALEQAWLHIPDLARPKPDLDKLATPRPELRAIATHPPIVAK